MFSNYSKTIRTAVKKELPTYLKEALLAYLETLIPNILLALFASLPTKDSNLNSLYTF